MAYSTIDKSSDFFNNVLYTGNGSTQSITGVGFEPDLLWLKCRTGSENHTVVDSVRGDSGAASGYYTLQTNDNNAQSSGSWNTLVDAITSDGFNLGNNDQVNSSSQPFVSWSWKAGTTTGITQGSATITPTSYSFNQTSGFSIIKYVGTGANATVPHGLGVAPTAIVTKNLSATQSWCNGITAMGWTKNLHFNETGAAETTTGIWNDTEPDATKFSVGTNTKTNASGQDMIAYCWAPISGYSKFGMYTGNGNTDGTFVYTGFKPSWVVAKRELNGSENWHIIDDKINPFNAMDTDLFVNTNGAAGTSSSYDMDMLSNGFKFRTSDSSLNTDGTQYIYMAFGQPIISNSGVCATAR